jgi:hypothetical protein
LGNTFFDRVCRDVTGEIVALSALMAGLFLLALYSGFFHVGIDDFLHGLFG